MTTIMTLPLQQAYPEMIRDLQEKFPSANLRIEVRKNDISKLLTEKDFWQIISLLDWTDADDDDRVLEPAVDALAKLPVHHIYLFSDVLANKLFQLDGKIFGENIGEDAYSPNRYFSVDNFLYARCCAVANGEVFYKNLLENPQLMPKDLTFESLLSLASKAYFQKTGKSFDYISATPIETYTNKMAW